jgi:hypothetical protein
MATMRASSPGSRGNLVAAISSDALQALMRHKSYSTTQRYIAIARQMDDAVASLHVPEVVKTTVR